MSDDMNAPQNGGTAPSLANLVPEMSMTQYNTKNSTEMMALTPKPPFPINAPRGAPMKKSMKQKRQMQNLRRRKVRQMVGV